MVLRTAAKRMVAATRDYDAVGRYGGEEFLIVLPGCDHRCATSSAIRILNCIGKEAVDSSEGMIPITVSLGIAASIPKQRMDQDAMVKAADEALYRAKANGRNRFEVAQALP
jgi:diguanylate cyclase (GGDEF)-like protein